MVWVAQGKNNVYGALPFVVKCVIFFCLSVCTHSYFVNLPGYCVPPG
jgi:hypothetical protein